MKHSLRLVGTAILVATASCGGREASRYEGSAMDDSAPDSSATLTLTLWPTRDTTFVGFIRAREPVGQGGDASAWLQGATLRVYSVSADGDTVVWMSRHPDETLGGTYEATGGVTKGLGGTWRASLVAGPPATQETLDRAMKRASIPPFDAVWPAVVFVTVIIACARWVRAAPVPATERERDPLGVLDTRVGGFLLFFVFGQLLALAMALFQLRDFTSEFTNGLWESGAAVAGLRGTIVVEKLVAVTRVVTTVLGLHLIATRSHLAPRFWLTYLVLLAVFMVGDLAIAAWIADQSKQLAGSSAGGFDENGTRTRIHVLRSVLILLVWSMYWCQSMRVRARFGYAALDRAAPLPPAPGTALAS
jgi:hypothetical protein